MAQVHRFRDSVGVHINAGGETVYLTAREARDLAAALLKAARSVERERFVDSSGNTTSFDPYATTNRDELSRDENGKALPVKRTR